MAHEPIRRPQVPRPPRPAELGEAIGGQWGNITHALSGQPTTPPAIPIQPPPLRPLNLPARSAELGGGSLGQPLDPRLPEGPGRPPRALNRDPVVLNPLPPHHWAAEPGREKPVLRRFIEEGDRPEFNMASRGVMPELVPPGRSISTNRLAPLVQVATNRVVETAEGRKALAEAIGEFNQSKFDFADLRDDPNGPKGAAEKLADVIAERMIGEMLGGFTREQRQENARILATAMLNSEAVRRLGANLEYEGAPELVEKSLEGQIDHFSKTIDESKPPGDRARRFRSALVAEAKNLKDQRGRNSNLAAEAQALIELAETKLNNLLSGPQSASTEAWADAMRDEVERLKNVREGYYDMALRVAQIANMHHQGVRPPPEDIRQFGGMPGPLEFTARRPMEAKYRGGPEPDITSQAMGGSESGLREKYVNVPDPVPLNLESPEQLAAGVVRRAIETGDPAFVADIWRQLAFEHGLPPIPAGTKPNEVLDAMMRAAMSSPRAMEVINTEWHGPTSSQTVMDGLKKLVAMTGEPYSESRGRALFESATREQPRLGFGLETGPIDTLTGRDQSGFELVETREETYTTPGTRLAKRKTGEKVTVVPHVGILGDLIERWDSGEISTGDMASIGIFVREHSYEMPEWREAGRFSSELNTSAPVNSVAEEIASSILMSGREKAVAAGLMLFGESAFRVETDVFGVDTEKGALRKTPNQFGENSPLLWAATLEMSEAVLDVLDRPLDSNRKPGDLMNVLAAHAKFSNPDLGNKPPMYLNDGESFTDASYRETLRSKIDSQHGGMMNWLGMNDTYDIESQVVTAKSPAMRRIREAAGDRIDAAKNRDELVAALAHGAILAIKRNLINEPMPYSMREQDKIAKPIIERVNKKLAKGMTQDQLEFLQSIGWPITDDMRDAIGNTSPRSRTLSKQEMRELEEMGGEFDF